ncbi:phosphoribosyl-AMP cyclohydrolase [Fulvitalea axinellae]|uniref:phosphoribosyl-AMP cyclohydrolase n=1 Tax=Fulvitalea axinellae TaxID=1182444 RepID=UPI0030CA4D88
MITKQDIQDIQKKWGEAIVKIGTLKEDRSACEEVTSGLITSLYAFEDGHILFKPTKAAAEQFRPDHKAALSYFIGGDSDFPEDGGFALQPWTKVRFENAHILLDTNRATAMGNYFFTGEDGSETKVEYTFGYKKNDAGELKIELHHSSLPFAPQPVV